ANTSASITNRPEMDTSMLRAGTALFAASDEVSPEEFARFASRLEFGVRYPGIQGIGFTRRLRPDEIAPFIERVRSRDPSKGQRTDKQWWANRGVPAGRDHAPDDEFTIWPAGERDEYHTIEYLEPPDARNLAALGF